MSWLSWLAALRLLTGEATYYAPGLMEEVVRNRLAWGQITEAQVASHIGYAALLGEGSIGNTIWISHGDGWYGPLLVVDCAGVGDRGVLAARGWAVDLDHATAATLGIVQDGQPRQVLILEVRR